MASAKTWRQLLGALIGVLIAFVSVNLLFNPRPNAHEPLFAMDAWVYDLLLENREVRTEGAPEIFIVSFGEDSFAALKSVDARSAQWPWSPRLFAQVVRRLEELGVSVIAIDKMFVDPHNLNPDDDQTALERELAEACREHGKVILAAKIQTDELDDIGRVENLVRPLSVLRDSASVGLITLPLDPDRSIRNGFIFREHQGVTYPYLATEAYRLYEDLPPDTLRPDLPHGVTLGDRYVPLRHTKVHITYDPQLAEELPFAWFTDDLYDVMFGELADFFESDESEDSPAFDLGRLRNSIVFMGATLGELQHDSFTTPIGSQTPGVEIHANMARMLFAGDFLTPIHDKVQIWVTFLLASILSVMCAFASLRVGILGSVCTVAALVFVSAVAFLSGGYVSRIVTPSACLFVTTAATVSYRYIFEEREKRYLKRLFSKATDATLVEQLLNNPELVKLGGDRREVTILFSDIRSFSTLSETMAPEVLIGLLNEYFSKMTEVIFRNHGMIDKFIGDAVMAEFGAPVPSDDHAYWACKAAVEMLEAQHEVSKSWEAQGHSAFRIGVGIHTGYAVLGNLGSEQRSDYTCIGDAVNVSSRIEGLNKTFKTELLISEDTYAACSESLDAREVGHSDIRGRKEKVLLYELQRVRSREETSTTAR